MKQKFSVRLAVASHLDEDYSEMESFRYQSTKTPCPVYSYYESDYFTATESPAKKPRQNIDYQWEPVDSWVSGHYGWQIWKRKPEPED